MSTESGLRVRVLMEPRHGARYEEILALARATEDAGFDAFFRSDHLMGVDPQDPSYLPTDCWTTLAGLARETTRGRLGALVGAATFRQPGLLATIVASVDEMSGGRVELGLGTGWYEREHAAFGIPFPPRAERFDRLEEQLAVITGLWSGPGFTFEGTARDLARHSAVWQRVAWSQGEKGELSALFARWRVRVTAQSNGRRILTDESGWLLAERVGKRTKYYLAWGFDEASLEELVMYAHLRWTIEKFHRDAKQELALDSFEGRTWKGWHHHMTIVLLAFAFLATLRSEGLSTARPPTFREVLHVLHVERAVQLAMQEGLSREKALPVAKAFVRGMTDY
jgi:hypothetical protein